MQQFLDVWLTVNSLLALVWGFTLVVFITKCNGGRNIKLAETIQQFTELVAFAFVAMSVTSMFSGYMPNLMRFIQ